MTHLLSLQYDMTTGRGRLEAAVPFLRRVHAEERDFHIGHWACGTSACAVGWIAQDPEFMDAGIKLENAGRFGEVSPVYLDLNYFDAVAAFFDIPYDIVDHFFAPESYAGAPTALDVAARIEAYLAEAV